MFALVSLRIAARRVSTAPALTRTAGVTPRWVPNTLTRSFITSVARAEPASTKTKTTTKAKKSAPKKETAKKTVEAKAKAKKVIKKKPVKKVTKPKQIRIPSTVKIPSLGMGPYLYFTSKIYKPELPVTQANFLANSRSAAEAWKALPESEKQKLTEITKAQRVKALEERQAYINALDPTILRELNRRRVAKGKNKLHRRLGGAANPYVIWVREYRLSHPEIFHDNKFGTRLGEIWRGMSAEEKQPYLDQYEAAKAEKAARKQA